MISVTCPACGTLNEAPEMNTTTFRSICGRNGVQGCNSFIPLERWQTENGFRVIDSLHRKHCAKCGTTYWGQEWANRCLNCFNRKKEALHGRAD